MAGPKPGGMIWTRCITRASPRRGPSSVTMGRRCSRIPWASWSPAKPSRRSCLTTTMIVLDDRPVYQLKTAPAVLASYDEAIERARALKPILRERARETEQLRRLPAQNVADLLENGLYGLMTPKRFGGSELGSQTMIDVTIELASACPSTGWVHMLWTAHMWLLALFPPQAQEELWSNPNTLASSVVNTVGDVVPVEGGYRWTGRGFFSSGVDHCNWLTAAVPIKRPDTPED